MTPRPTHLTRYIRARRIELGLTQREIAEALGYKPQFVTNWERGTSRPPVRALKKLARVLKIRPAFMVEVLIQDSGDAWRKTLGVRG